MSTFGQAPNPFGSLPSGSTTTTPKTRGAWLKASAGGNFSHPWALGKPASTQFNPPTFISQLTSAAMKDITSMKGAADRQKASLDRLIGQNQSLVNSFSKDYASGLNTSLGEMSGLVGDIRKLGSDQSSEFNQNASQVMARANQGADSVVAGANRIDQDIAGAYSYADQAIATSKDALNNYDQSTSENAIGATITGIRENVAQQKQMIANGLNPDGTMMTQAERQEAMRNLESDTQRTIATTAAGMREQVQKTIADLTNTVASFQSNAANVHLQGGQLRMGANQQRLAAEEFRAGVGTTVNQQRLESQAGQRDLMRLATGITDTMAQLRTAGKLAGFQAELSGRQGIFEEMASNPESVISMVPTLLMLGQVASAPGGRGMQGLEFRNLV